MGLILMIITVGGALAAMASLIFAAATKRVWLMKFVLGGTVIWLAIYFMVLLGVSIQSEERHLGLNEAKTFCGFYLDCHMHMAVTDVRRTKAIGNKTATGEFYVVKVKVFSDAVRVILGLHSVDAHVVDIRQRQYARDIAAEEQLVPQPAFEKQIGPKESFEKEIVFDLPVDVVRPRLDITQGFGIDMVIELALIGDEDSLLHKRNYFDILEQAQTSSVK